MRTYLLAVSLVLVGLVAFGSRSIASADAPVVVGPVHDEGTVEFVDCGAFKILDQFVLNFVQRRFFDQNGTLVRIEEHSWGTDTFVNSMTGKSLTGRFSNNGLIDPAIRMGSITGIIFRLTVPGVGAVFLDVGRIVTNQAGTIVTFQAGPHQFFDGDIAGLCAALA